MSKYREELIQTIKDMGQELINRAESMVHEDCDMISNFSITIDIPQPMDGYPELTWSTTVLNKTVYNRKLGTNDFECEVKGKTHAESVTMEPLIKRGYWSKSYSPELDQTSAMCSVCKGQILFNGKIDTYHPDTCPTCGAIMS